MERIRAHLKVDKWLVFGGSWGSTLALAYAETHPAVCTEIVLRGVFLLRKAEIAWFYEDVNGASAIYPDAWEHFLAPIPLAERGELVKAYHKRLTSDDPAERKAAARAWAVWEGSTSKLRPDPNFIQKYEDDAFAEAFSRIECHYFVNSGFFTGPGHADEGGAAGKDTSLLGNVHKIRHLPCVIVQGRYDIVCPIMSAWALHRAWPEADLKIIGDAGHSCFEPGISSELVAATNRFRPPVA
jgi:proline iminopeptidase